MAIKVKDIAANGGAISESLTAGDIDRYPVVLTAGYSYQFEIKGNGTGAGTLALPEIAISANQTNYFSGTDGELIANGDRVLTFNPTTSMVYYVNVRGTGGGTYALASTPTDEGANTFAAATPFGTDASVAAGFQTRNDTDVYVLNLTAGVTYQFDLKGQGTGAGTATDLNLRLSGGSANTVTPLIGDERVTFKPITTSAYYLVVKGKPGTYTLTSTSNPGGPAPLTVAAGGSLTTTAGSNNLISVPGGGTVNTVAGSTNKVTFGSGAGVINSAGTDTVIGNAGPVTVNATGTVLAVGGAGGMAFTNGAGNSIVFAGSGGLTYQGGTGTDLVVGFGSPVNVKGGTGGGTYFGGGNSTIVAGNGAQAVMVGYAGDKLYSAGAAGDLFGANAGGDILMDGSASTGNDVFFGASGTGRLTFITGSGNDIIAVGQGTNDVRLGSGRSTVFANTGTTANTTITAGTGSADIGMGGNSVNLVLAAANARNFALFNFVPGADKITLSGFDASAAANAVANQTVSNGIATLRLPDSTTIQFINSGRVGLNVFA